MATFTLYLPDSLLVVLDERRGEAGRSGFIRAVLERELPVLSARPVVDELAGDEVTIDARPLRKPRSPKPELDLEAPRKRSKPPPEVEAAVEGHIEGVAGWAASVPGVRASQLAKRPLDRPIVQKRK